MVTAARWWHRRDDQVVCTLCPRECALHEGQRGFCFVRQNVAGEMQLTTYGRSTGFCIDPIEKKPLNHFLPGTPVLSFGTAGCNLGCKFCQNWSISKSREVERLSETAGPAEIAAAAVESGCRSVAFTYNDPVVWAEYALDTARECRQRGLKTVAVTAGYITPEARPEFFSEMDAANVDLKGFTEDFYKYTTLSHLQPVLDTLVWLKRETNVWFELTNLMIPGENDSADETSRMCDWIVEHLGPDVPVHFTAFHPDFRMRDTPPTPPATLQRAREQALSAGIHYPYVGNVHDVAGQSTYCHHCGLPLIERDWYQLGDWNLRDGRCARCQTVIPGVFESRPGTWGARRLPIRIPQAIIPLTIPANLPTQHSSENSATPAPSLTSSIPSLSSTSMTSLSPQPATQPSGTTSYPTTPAPTTAVEFTAEEIQALARVTREMSVAILNDQPLPTLPTELANRPTYGLFVTYRRTGDLRACRGRFGGTTSLGELLRDIIPDTLANDPRFPRIASNELEGMLIELSVMYAPRTITTHGQERLNEVVVGRHGLVLQHPQGRGLLLPQVATEAHWNAAQFLEGISRKAGLHAQAWSDPAAQLMTFEARIIDSPPPQPELDPATISAEDWDTLLERLDTSDPTTCAATDLIPASLREWANQTRPETFGVILQGANGTGAAEFGTGESFSAVLHRAHTQLRQQPVKTDSDTGAGISRLARILVLTGTIPLTPLDDPARWRSQVGRAWVVRRGERWGLQVPQSVTQATLPGLLQVVEAQIGDWASSQATTAVVTCQMFQYPPHGQTRPEPIRPAAQAGRFYPASAAEMQQQIAQYLTAASPPREVRAIMLPHAGWKYCGSVLGETVARTVVPKTVILIGPKHTAAGPAWSVSSSLTWQIPGAFVPIATRLRERLLELVPQIHCEAEAHRSEHGLEVIVPFLLAKQPDLQILPLVLGATSYAQTERLAQGLAILARESSEPLLLVISSDMHHFAAEAENRRLDQLAIDALLTGDPSRLFDVVNGNNISMCGVMPAVTVLRALHYLGQSPHPKLVRYDNSATASGETSRVVGYAGMLIP